MRDAMRAVLIALIMAAAIMVLLPSSAGESMDYSDHSEMLSGDFEMTEVRFDGDTPYIGLETVDDEGIYARTDDGPTEATYGETAVWDSYRKLMLMFGGYSGSYHNTTWIYDPVIDVFSASTSYGGPTGRMNTRMVYASAEDKIVLFGGKTGSSTYGDDTWIYDPQADSWKRVYPEYHPLAREFHGMTYDEGTGEVILYGGGNGTGSFGDLWTYDIGSNVWTNRTPETGPGVRKGHGMVYDPQNEISVVFGGLAGGRSDEVWSYDGRSNEWAHLNPPTGPSARLDHSMVYTRSNGIIVYGGEDTSYLGDLWSYSVHENAWTELDSDAPGGNRSLFAMVYDDVHDGVLISGGRSIQWGGYARFEFDTVDDSSSDIGERSDMVLDSDGHPHISYHDDTNNRIRYAEWTGSTWETTPIVLTAISLNAIDLDPQGFPHIIYRTGSSDLAHAYKDVNGWHTETVDMNHDDSNGGLDMVIDRSGNIHVAYHDFSSKDLYYTKKDTEWSTPSAIDTANDTGYQPSIDVDILGNPHIAYGYYDGYDLMYVRSTDGGSTWKTPQLADDLIYFGAVPYCSLKVSHHGNPYITYRNAGAYLGFAYKFSGTWVSYNLSTAHDGMFTSMDLDRNGRPVITCYDQADDDIHWLYLDRDKFWRTGTVDFSASTTGSVGTACAMADDGTLHVTYQDSDMTLTHARNILPNWRIGLESGEWTNFGNNMDGPFPVQTNGLVYDTSIDRFVMFGGQDWDWQLDGSGYSNQTWAYDPETRSWERMYAINPPSPREGFGMVHVPTHGRSYLFGGRDDNGECKDLWYYDGGRNIWVNESFYWTSPVARAYHDIAYDTSMDRLVMFGGWSSGYLSDTWAYDVKYEYWTNMNPSSGPNARSNHQMEFDRTDEVVILHGGGGAAGKNADTWTYDLATNTWTNITSGAVPLKRSGPSLSYDSDTDEIVAFGGFTDHYEQETWKFAYENGSGSWYSDGARTPPSKRGASAMEHSSDHGIHLLYGGRGVSIERRESFHYSNDNFHVAGTYVTEPFQVDPEHGVIWSTISWKASIPNGGHIGFQLAVSEDPSEWNYVGPDGTSSTWYNDMTGGELFHGYWGEWARVKVFFRSVKAGDSPKLYGITLSWDEIDPASVSLYSPNGGEDLIENGSHVITWKASGDLMDTPINLYYSITGGDLWMLVAKDVPNSGFYNWTVPQVESATALVLVTCIDIMGTNVSDASDMTFAIDPPANWMIPGAGGTDTGGNGGGGGPSDDTVVPDGARTQSDGKGSGSGDEEPFIMISGLIVVLLLGTLIMADINRR